MSAFSSSAFSTGAFSPGAYDFGSSPTPTPTPTPTVELLGGKAYPARHSYVTPYQKHQEETYQKDKRENLARIEEELAYAERDRLEKIAEAAAARKAKKAARELAVAGLKLQQEINRLRTERAWLIRQMDDEEALLLLLMTLPLH
jgi:hypothetical protein